MGVTKFDLDFHTQRAKISGVCMRKYCFSGNFFFVFLSLLQPSHPNSTGNCTTVDGKPIDKIHSNGTHCTSGLEMTETQFNLLYAIYAWT